MPGWTWEPVTVSIVVLGAGPLLSHLIFLLRSLNIPHKPAWQYSWAWCGDRKMTLLKYTFLYVPPPQNSIHIIKQNTTPEQILQTAEIEGKLSPIMEGSLGLQKYQGPLQVASFPVFVFRPLNT